MKDWDKELFVRIPKDLFEDGFDAEDVVTYLNNEIAKVADDVTESQARDYVDRAELENGERL